MPPSIHYDLFQIDIHLTKVSISVMSFPMATYDNPKALSKIKPTRSVFDVKQRSRSCFTTRGQGQCVVIYYLEVKWKSVTQTARQINVFISYSKYIILDEHLEIWFSVYVVQCTLYPNINISLQSWQ